MPEASPQAAASRGGVARERTKVSETRDRIPTSPPV